MGKVFTHNSKTDEEFYNKEILNTYFGEKKTTPKKQPFSFYNKFKKSPYSRFIILGLELLPIVVILIIIVSIFSYKFSYYSFLAKYSTVDLKSPVELPKNYYVKLIFNDMFNRDFIQKVSFNGDAQKKSIFLRNSIRLVNSMETGWAKVSLNLKKKIDFQNKIINILARTSNKPNSAYVIITDSNSNTISMPIIISSKWAWYNVQIPYLDNFKYTDVKKIDIEFGQDSTGNDDASMIYLKELNIKAKQEQ